MKLGKGISGEWWWDEIRERGEPRKITKNPDITYHMTSRRYWNSSSSSSREKASGLTVWTAIFILL